MYIVQPLPSFPALYILNKILFFSYISKNRTLIILQCCIMLGETKRYLEITVF
jgi:hypothetical protein